MNTASTNTNAKKQPSRLSLLFLLIAALLIMAGTVATANALNRERSATSLYGLDTVFNITTTTNESASSIGASLIVKDVNGSIAKSDGAL